MRILIVEDNKLIADCTKTLLWQHDRKFASVAVIDGILVAETLERALRIIEDGDVILCDGFFPTRDGGPAMENWSIVADRAQRVRRGIPVVVYSSDPQVLDMARLCGLEALAKPTPVETIYRALAGWKTDSGIGVTAGINMVPEQAA